MFVAALFIIAKNGNTPNVHDRINGETKCVYLCKQVLFGNKNKRDAGACCNMDEL